MSSPQPSQSNPSYSAKNQINVGGSVYGGSQHAGDVYATTYIQDSNNAITIDDRYLAQLPEDFTKSLVDFANLVSKEIKKENIPASSGAPIKNSVNELAEATTKIMEGGVNEEKKKTIREKLKEVAVTLARLSPKIARTILNFTPLAPFSNLVGEGFDKMVEEALP